MAAANTDIHTFDLADVPPEDRDQVEAMIPSQAVTDAYTHRTMPGGFSDFDYFDMAFKTRHNILMAGPTGSGKTTAARAYAGSLGLPLASIEFNGAMDPATTIGAQLVDPISGLPKWKDGEITMVTRHKGIIVLEEVNNMSGRFTAAYHGLLDARQSLYIPELGERVLKSENTLVFATYNPKYHGTNQLNEAFLNRFAYTIDPWDYDPDVEDERVGAYTPTLLRLVREFRAEENLLADIGTNAMEEFIEIALGLNVEAAIYLFLNKVPPEDRAIMGDVLEAEIYVLRSEIGAD